MNVISRLNFNMAAFQATNFRKVVDGCNHSMKMINATSDSTGIGIDLYMASGDNGNVIQCL